MGLVLTTRGGKVLATVQPVDGPLPLAQALQTMDVLLITVNDDDSEVRSVDTFVEPKPSTRRPPRKPRSAVTKP